MVEVHQTPLPHHQSRCFAVDGHTPVLKMLFQKLHWNSRWNKANISLATLITRSSCSAPCHKWHRAPVLPGSERQGKDTQELCQRGRSQSKSRPMRANSAVPAKPGTEEPFHPLPAPGRELFSSTWFQHKCTWSSSLFFYYYFFCFPKKAAANPMSKLRWWTRPPFPAWVTAGPRLVPAHRQTWLLSFLPTSAENHNYAKSPIPQPFWEKCLTAQTVSASQRLSFARRKNSQPPRPYLIFRPMKFVHVKI